MRIKKSMIYKRIFGIHMILIIFLLISLDIYFIRKELSNIEKNTLYISEKVAYDINDEINNINNSTSLIIKNMYNDKYIVNDIMEFLNMDSVSYSKHKLDKFISSDEYFYNGIESFTRNSFDMNESLFSMSFVSHQMEEVSTFNRQNQIKIKKKEIGYLGEKYTFSNNILGNNIISYIREIRDPITFEVKGEVICTYNLDKLKKIVNRYEDKYEVMVLDSEGYVVFDSSEEYDYEEYPYFKKVMESSNEVELDKKYYINKKVNTSTLITIVKSPEIRIADLNKGFYSSLLFIDILLFLIVERILYIKLKGLSDRTDTILDAMENVENGQFNTSIPITGDNDDINYISENFNRMCKNLNEHIEKSYLAELNQKNAEMVALQNQINPHFLYNTLESIRMKAICNGDKDVGKMLYTLAFLFRKQVKDKNIISIKSELEYCEKYLEIFKFRYDEKFEYIVNCDEKFLNKEIIKFTLQPLIENYFVHGISLENYDNKLKIEIKSEDEDMIILIKDNGNGLEEKKIEILNDMLDKRINYGQSIGILNAHERIQIQYGKNYGVKLSNNEDKGMVVAVRLPCREVDENV